MQNQLPCIFIIVCVSCNSVIRRLSARAFSHRWPWLVPRPSHNAGRQGRYQTLSIWCMWIHWLDARTTILISTLCFRGSLPITIVRVWIPYVEWYKCFFIFCNAELDLDDPSTFRDLGKPMGAQTPVSHHSTWTWILFLFKYTRVVLWLRSLRCVTMKLIIVQAWYCTSSHLHSSVSCMCVTILWQCSLCVGSSWRVQRAVWELGWCGGRWASIPLRYSTIIRVVTWWLATLKCQLFMWICFRVNF